VVLIIGKTKKQIQEDEKAELEKIVAIEKRNQKVEVWKAQTLEELVAIGKARGYQNAYAWAKIKMKFKGANKK
jgi:hypothetical protein